MKQSTRFAKLHRGLAIGLLLLVAPAALTRAQSGLPYLIEPPEGSVSFGRAVASGGDADGDGLPDIFVADPGFSDQLGVVGRWYVLSGIDGSLIWSFTGDRSYEPFSEFRIVGAMIGDINGDGRAEVIVGVPDADDWRGVVYVHSGRTGEVLYQYAGERSPDWLGVEVQGVGDLTGDDVPDFAFVGRYADSGHFIFCSGATGEEIGRYATTPATKPLRIRPAGDLNGDRITDVVVGSIRGASGAPPYGEVHAISGATLDPLWIREGDPSLGWSLAAGVDFTGDEVPDVFSFDSSRQQVIGLSGATGNVVRSFDPPARGQLWGSALALGDANADGRMELVAMRVAAQRFGIDVMNPTSARTLHWAQGPAPKSSFNSFTGNEMAVADVNGDGSDDFIIGSVGNGVSVFGGGTLLLNFAQRRDDYNISAGQAYDFTVGGGKPGRVMHLLGSITGNGCTFVQQLGICIDLDRRIYNLGSAVSDADRVAHFAVQVPLNMPRGPVWLQAVDPADPARGPIKSNVMRLEVVE